MTVRHVLDVEDLSADEVAAVLDLAEEATPRRVLEGKGAALIFEKPSARTRNSMEIAVFELGGHPVTVRPDEIGLDTREAVEDVARTLSCYHAVIGARVFEHAKLVRLATAATVPVVNLLSDDAHPCQALADVLTLRQRFGALSDRSLAYVGDGNNMAHSLIWAAARTGLDIRLATPSGYEPDPDVVERARAAGADILLTSDPAEAVKGADAVYTDVWTSMGQEAEAARRRDAFRGFTVDQRLMSIASPDAIFLHCLPVHRGEEVTAEVVDGSQSAIWHQAANRLHAQRGLLVWLLQNAAG